MIHARSMGQIATSSRRDRIGTGGHLAVFAWSLAMVMLVSPERILLAGAASLGVSLLLYPHAFRRIMRPRYLVVLALLALPPLLMLGDADMIVLGLRLSSEGLVAAVQMVTRCVVVVVAVSGLTGAVEVSAIAGLWERIGLKGLGFSVGVALNLLPALELSAANAWHSLWMRGGLRRGRLRAMRLLLVTVMSNALLRAEEIALAAEMRAFSPECARPLPVRSGRLDWLVTALAPICLLLLCYAG